MTLKCLCGNEIEVELTGAYLTLGQNVRCTECFRVFNVRITEAHG